jgi:hypothetical protein
VTPSEPPSTATKWKLHITLFAGLTLCVIAFTVEIRRAVHGHWGAWVYVVEWPVFAIFGTYVWWRLLHQGTESDRAASEQPATPIAGAQSEPAEPDAELDAWNAYVERLRQSEEGRSDEPGRPS